MLTIVGHHLGDTWYFVENDEAHCYFLIGSDQAARHTAWDIGHATSRDLKTWTYHGIVLRRGAADAWDGICLATGTILRQGDRYWMAYTGNWFGPQPAVGLAYSSNLHDWHKLPGNPISAIDEQHYTARSRGSRAFPHWRDPFLFEHDGWVYHLTCATAANQTGRAGAIGAARSRDMRDWQILPPLDVEPFAEELECPQVVAAAGRYYLMFSTHSDLLLDRCADEAGGNMYGMVGDSPLGPFRLLSREPVLSPALAERPYAGRIVWLRDRAWLLGTIWRDSGDQIADPIPVTFTPSGIVTG